ncbi:GNAT family N-acetyltransferase [Aliarcobacter butzleri]|uniref:GNAT family N-acetyltransferase n=1 Tax=Aliarcobacter butzleri TaxID=28197 RepID=UPI00125F0A97|nr:GNAT family N-acetyltransferase [Aliarcobacter butzleri]MCT7595798.1 GNAT family N-acetyltransferase [Aliarcobacter butzleri]MCT7600313.1 GNAT family N-acetyltransferase [Aliarcobacter butzleri]MCT7653572.1 GNAT family N-acetyltransferase [Aliarcobacter butzleri]MDN5046147.1 GNAT family N-acetyltransferase [Aliarcobacter butzleri]
MIKKAKKENLKDLYDLEKKVFQNDPFALTKSAFRYHILKNNLYIFEKDEKIVGYILWLERKDYFRLYSLAIDINFQDLGIASKLLEYSFEKLRNKNFSLEVKTKNIKAIKLYEKYGFKIKKVLKNYYEDSDGYLMIK